MIILRYSRCIIVDKKCNKWHSNYVNWFCKFQSLVTIQPLNGELIKKEKCGADFVYRMEGCGEPESDKRYNTPHLIDMGYRRTKIRLAIC